MDLGVGSDHCLQTDDQRPPATRRPPPARRRHGQPQATHHHTPDDTGNRLRRRPSTQPNPDTAAITVYPTTSPQSEQTTSLAKHLRDDILPPLAKATRTTIYVGGATATQIDFAHVLAGKLPLFIGVVVLLSALPALERGRLMTPPPDWHQAERLLERSRRGFGSEVRRASVGGSS
jgi:hypothetical protein